MKRAVLLALLALVPGACSEPLEFGDWTIPVPEGVRIIEYAHVPLEERTERIERVEDLVIGAGSGDPRYSFYQAWGLAIDSRGFMYVMDRGNHRVQVFDEQGQYVRTLGAEGQGPGELQDPMSIAIAGDTVVVIDPANARLNHWSTLDGEYLGAAPLQERSLMATGLADGAMVGAFVIFHREPEFWRERVYARVAVDGTELARYTIFRALPSVSVSIPYSTPRVAASSGGDVYISRSDRYQVLAFDADGDPRWALRTTWPTPEIPQEVFDNTIERLRERQPDYEPRDEWPVRMPAIGNVVADGNGNLYVFPYVFSPRDPYTGRPAGDAPDEFAVDVYSPDGELLSAAVMSVMGWRAASGDYVYSLGLDPETEEEVLRRYRLVVPWEQ